MPTRKNIPHTDADLRIGSQYLIYHIRMYVETLLWLQANETRPEGWNTIRNAILEDNLVHARILIHFVCNPNKQTNTLDTDMLAVDYFHGRSSVFPLNSGFLIMQAKNIGGHLVHLTTRAIPDLKSQQEWDISGIACRLVPALNQFLEAVPEERVVTGVRKDSLAFLARLSSSEETNPLRATT
jgi:hypothetical protein